MMSNMSNRQIGDLCGVSSTFVDNLYRMLADEASCPDSQLQTVCSSDSAQLSSDDGSRNRRIGKDGKIRRMPTKPPEPTPQPEDNAGAGMLIDHYPEIAEAVRERYPVDGDAQPGIIATIHDGEFIFCVRDHEEVLDFVLRLFPYDAEEPHSSWKRNNPERIERARKDGFMLIFSLFGDEASFSQMTDPRNDPPHPIWQGRAYNG